jgi:hypothetical protein
MKHSKGHKGKIRHSDMGSLHAISSEKGHDSLAHESHAAKNKAHLTGTGFNPPNEYEGGGEQEGISGSGGNCCYED